MFRFAGAVIALCVGSAATAAPLVTPVFTFAATKGGYGALAADSAGNVYGALPYDGPNGHGQIFRLAPPGSPGGAWSETILYSFDGTLGSEPAGGVTLAHDGSLIVTAESGGSFGAGTVIRLSPTASGPWTPSLLYAFTGGADGGLPASALIENAAGTLFGTTYKGGTSAKGAVFALSPNGAGGFTQSVLYSFTGGMDGAGPAEPLVADAEGHLFGTTVSGGGSIECTGAYQGCGTAFSLARTASSPSGWAERVIGRYSGAFPLGAFPGALTLHGAHELVGTAAEGPVYAFVPTGPAPVKWTDTTIYAFPTSRGGQQAHGGDPDGNVVTTPSGKLIGSAVYGGTTVGYGGLYEITAPVPGHGGSETLFYSYPGFSQSYPTTDILVAPGGLLYQLGGNTMLQITPD